MFCNRPDKKGVSRSDPADTFFLFRRKRENGASGRNGTDAPKGEKNDHLFRLTTPFCRMMFAYCEVSPLCTM